MPIMSLPRVYVYEDLAEAKVISNRSQLHRLQKEQGFPKPVSLSGSIGARAFFPADEVDRWLADNLKPKDEAKVVPRPGSRPQGRPRRETAPTN
jgi:predicted DNA-binding transcriptional regulator AlpA